MFLHASWTHLLGNMAFLWVFGGHVERSMGHLRYLVFYFLCGLGADALEIATSATSNVSGLGASGAIAGVLGAYIVLYPRAQVLSWVFFLIVPLPAWLWLGIWFVTQLFEGAATLGRTGGVAYFAHIGGFVAGLVLVFVFAAGRRAELRRARRLPPGYGGWGGGGWA
ncbi:MAG: rhomboid family intramembrane serine protease [Ktedonobacterales bacterium]